MRPSSYLDANVFIYFVEGEPAVATEVRELFEAREQAPHRAVTSELILADALRVASAARAGCDFFMSGDSDRKRLPEGMIWLPPDAAGVRAFLDAST